MSNLEDIKTLDACIWGISKYERAGNFQQAIHIRMIIMMIGAVRERLAEGSPWKGKLFMPEELVKDDLAPVEEVADAILKEINGE